MRREAARRTGPALEAMYRFMLWLVEATYTRERMALLTQANLGIEKLRFLFRLAMDLRHLDLGRYEHAARAL